MKIIKLTESDLTKLVKKILKESEDDWSWADESLTNNDDPIQEFIYSMMYNLKMEKPQHGVTVYKDPISGEILMVDSFSTPIQDKGTGDKTQHNLFVNNYIWKKLEGMGLSASNINKNLKEMFYYMFKQNIDTVTGLNNMGEIPYFVPNN